MFGLFSGPAFDPKDIPDLSGKVIIVTGGNVGLGYETVLNLAAHNPSSIYLCARTRAKYDAAMKGIVDTIPTAASFVHHLELDLSSLSSVQTAAQTFLSSNTRLDILMNNAGIMALPPGLTTDGYELQFGTNHLGHFLLTRLLLPILQSTATSTSPPSDVRIINLSSAGHQLAPGPTGFLPALCTTEMRDYSTWTRYGQSKLANILFTQQLAKRYPDITSVAIHPGTVQTNLANGWLGEHALITKLVWPLRGVLFSTSKLGALNQTWAAVAPVRGRGEGGSETVGNKGRGKGEVESGLYYVPVAKLSGTSAYGKDAKLSAELWEWSEKEMEKKGY